MLLKFDKPSCKILCYLKKENLVCATNGKQYRNECMMKCLTGRYSGVEAVWFGPCHGAIYPPPESEFMAPVSRDPNDEKTKNQKLDDAIKRARKKISMFFF